MQIDFVAHDDIPYTSAGSEDVYKHIKAAGIAKHNIAETLIISIVISIMYYVNCVLSFFFGF